MFDQPFAEGTDGASTVPFRGRSASQEKLRMIRTRLAAVLLAAAAFAASAVPASAAPGGKGDGKSNAGQAQDDHKPAGTGSGRKIG